MRVVFFRGILLSVIFIVLSAIPKTGFSEDLCVQLKWFHQSQFAGFYVAKEEGLYKREGLNVTFVEGGPHIQWQEKMKGVECPVGITNAYEIVVAKSKQIPIKAIASVAQVSPIVFFALEKSGIRDPRQFKGKKVALVPTGKIHLRGMLKKVGIPFDEIQLEPFSVNMTRLYKGEVDIWSGYITNLVTKAEEEGHRVNVIHPINYGIQIYDDVIYAREDLIANSPEVVERFLRASLKGWTKAIQDPELAVQHTLTYNKIKNAKHEKGLLLRTIPYIHTGEAPIGWMEKSIWDDICVLTKDVGLINQCVLSDRLYTDKFLRAIYKEQGP
jgi:NitT/TauT family transport system substrate-binding protein